MFVVAIVGVIIFLLAHNGKEIDAHMRDDVEEAVTGHAATGPSAQDA